MSVAEDIVFEERERTDKMKIPVIALIKSLGDEANVILKFWYGDVDVENMYDDECFEFRFNCADSYNAALEELPNLEGMLRDYVVHRIYTEAGLIEVHCVRKEMAK